MDIILLFIYAFTIFILVFILWMMAYFMYGCIKNSYNHYRQRKREKNLRQQNYEQFF